MKYSTKSTRIGNLCLYCNEPVRGSKRFCNDEEKIHWLEEHKPWFSDWRGVVEVERERQKLDHSQKFEQQLKDSLELHRQK